MISQKEKPGGVAANTGQGLNGQAVSINKNNTSSAAKNQAQLDVNTILFPFYLSHNETKPVKKISLSEFVQMVKSPRTGPKDNTTPALTPFKADGKTKEIAQASLYHAALVDHDHDNKDADGIQAIYDPYGMSYVAWSTSSHQQPGKGNRWKVLIPFSDPIGFDLWIEISRGSVLMWDADPAQARSQQIFYRPNKLTHDAPYAFIICLDRPFVDPAEPFHPFINDCLSAYTKELDEQKKQAAAAIPKPRRVNGCDGGIIEKVIQAYRMDELLQGAGYKKIGKKYLSPHSDSGSPGAIILNRDGKEVVYSHHGFSDPLSQQNNVGHSLDVFDVLCKLQYGGDITRAIRELAPQVDPDGQKQRQREYAEKNSTAVADFDGFKPDTDQGKVFDLSKFSLFGRSKKMEEKMLKDVHVLGKIAIMGQSTVFYAKPNTGKTLLVIYLLIQAIREGVIVGENIYYVNADDTYKGPVYKLKIAEKWGFHQLAPGAWPR